LRLIGCGWAWSRGPRLAAAGVLLLVALQPQEAAARPRKAPAPKPQAAAAPSATYADEHDCIAKAALEATECHNAAFNSHAEYEEKAPRLDSNDACLRIFGAHNCSMRIGGGKGIAFLPSYRGFRLIRGKSGEMMALPVVAGTAAGIEFAPRTVAQLDMAQDPGRAARAQAAWQSARAPVIRSARGGGGGSAPYRDAPKDAAIPSGDFEKGLPGSSQAYPVNPAMLKAMQEEMRKYGTPPPTK
jgi:uncharacterized protein YgiB involved in biofilm formation